MIFLSQFLFEVRGDNIVRDKDVHIDVAEKDGIDRETIEERTEFIDMPHRLKKNPREEEADEIDLIVWAVEDLIPNFPKKNDRLPSLKAACHHATLDLLSKLGLDRLVKIAKKRGLTGVYEELIEEGTYDYILNRGGRSTKKESEVRDAKEIIEIWHKIHLANENDDLQKLAWSFANTIKGKWRA